MVDSKRYLDWYAKGRQDLQAARILYEQGADNTLVCFHCQQAIEKHLKGYIIKHMQQLIEGHSLVKLCKICMQDKEEFKAYLKDLALVNEYYVETRYPADRPLDVSSDDAKECLDIADRQISFLEAQE